MTALHPVEVHNNKVWARFVTILGEEGLDDFFEALVRGSFCVGARLEDFLLVLLDVCSCGGRAIAYPDGDPVTEGCVDEWEDEVLATRVVGGRSAALMPDSANDN